MIDNTKRYMRSTPALKVATKPSPLRMAAVVVFDCALAFTVCFALGVLAVAVFRAVL